MASEIVAHLRGTESRHMPPWQAQAAASEIVAHCRGTNRGTEPRHRTEPNSRGTEPRHKPWHRTEPNHRGTAPNQTAVAQNRVR